MPGRDGACRGAAAFLGNIDAHLATDGVALIDTCPLYYSQMGHHLFSYFPRDEMPWAHLYPDFQQLLKTRHVDPWSIDRHNELNKLTVDGLMELIGRNGFVVEKSHIGTTAAADLARFRGKMDLSLAPSEEDLHAEWIHLVIRKAAPATCSS